jgi:hypothetical protein
LRGSGRTSKTSAMPLLWRTSRSATNCGGLSDQVNGTVYLQACGCACQYIWCTSFSPAPLPVAQATQETRRAAWVAWPFCLEQLSFARRPSTSKADHPKKISKAW